MLVFSSLLRQLLTGARLKIKRYRSAVAELLTLLLIIFGFTTIFLWIFVIDHKAIILYILAITGYTGVLFYQVCRKTSICCMPPDL